METKLTLRLNEQVIRKAKVYAKSQKTSLSKMIEAYLDSLTREEAESPKMAFTPLVESLSGVIELEPDFDHKETYSDYLTQKYS